MKKITAYILFYLLSANIIYAQYTEYNHINFYPPEAASLMRYVDYPIGYSTGIPDIQIPLYTISSKRLSLPLKLSFHTDNYLRLNQLPGVAGAGWSLNNKISITRVIRGMDDLSRQKFGYYTNNDIPVNYSGEYIIRDSEYLRKLHQNELDEEPDKFYYQLLDRSGSFFFQRQTDGSMKAIPVPNDGTNIKYNNVTGQFVIVDTNGTNYQFSTHSFDWSQPNYGPYTIMAWNCEKIYNAFGEEEFSFNYDQETIYTDIFDYNPRQEIYDDYKETSSGNNFLRCATDGQPLNTPFWDASGPKNISYSGREVKGEIWYEPYEQGLYLFKDYEHDLIAPPSGIVRNVSDNLLTSLTFKGGMIDFIYEKKHILTEIRIFSVLGGDRTLHKTIKLTHSAYSGSEILDDRISFLNNDAYKRTLNELEIEDQRYHFTYGATHEGNVLTDFWGYRSFDDYGSHIVYIPLMNTRIDLSIDEVNSYYEHNQIFETCRKPRQLRVNNYGLGSFDIFQQYPPISILKIKYPTGGSAEFIMEGNKFVDDNGQIKGCGGYRLAKILYYNNGDSVEKEKKYKYGENESGGGRIKIIPSSDPMTGNTFTEQTVNYYYGNGFSAPLEEIRTARKRTFYPSTTFSVNFDNGSNVIYGQVTEYESTNNSLTGKTVYYSNYIQGYPTGFPQYPYAIESEQSWSLGKLDSVLYYKWDPDIPGPVDLVKRKKYKYENHYDPIQIYQGRVWLKKIPELLAGSSLSPYLSYEEFFEANADFLYHQNSIRTGYHKLTKEEESLIDNGRITHTTEKTYFYRQPRDIHPYKAETVQSDGSILNNHYVYATDYITPNSNEGVFIDNLLSKNMVSLPIENITRRNGNIVSAILYLYNPNGTLASQMGLKQVLSNENIFKLSNKNTGDYSHVTDITTFNKSQYYKTDFNILRYDVYQNPVCIEDEEKGILIWYIWSYQGKHLVAEVKNATFEQVKTALGNIMPESLSASLLPDMTLINGLRVKLKGSQVTTYTYKPLTGITTITDPNGATTRYEYDTSGRLRYIKDNNAKIIQEYNYHYQP